MDWQEGGKIFHSWGPWSQPTLCYRATLISKFQPSIIHPPTHPSIIHPSTLTHLSILERYVADPT